MEVLIYSGITFLTKKSNKMNVFKNILTVAFILIGGFLIFQGSYISGSVLAAIGIAIALTTFKK